MRPCRTGRTIIVKAVLFILFMLGLCACGQKGKLYLPDQGQSALVRPVKTT